MKLVIFSFFFLAINNLTAQHTFDKWQREEIRDEFGDGTGKFVDAIYVRGKFSNTATVGSSLIAKITINEDGHTNIELFEYDENPADFQEGSGFVSVKLPDGTTKKIRCRSVKKKGLIFAETSSSIDPLKGESLVMKSLLTDTNGILRFVIDEKNFSTYYGTATYSFSVPGKAKSGK